MKTKTFTRGRQWLNPPAHPDTGAVLWGVSADGYSVDAFLTVRDCRREITLDFSAYNNRDMKQRVKKINDMIAALVNVRDNLEPAFKHHKEAEKAWEQKRKKEGKVAKRTITV